MTRLPFGGILVLGLTVAVARAVSFLGLVMELACGLWFGYLPNAKNVLALA